MINLGCREICFPIDEFDFQMIPNYYSLHTLNQETLGGKISNDNWFS